MSPEPTGERLARVETKIDLVLERLDTMAPKSDVALLRGEVDEIRSSRRWATSTFLSVGVAFASLAIAAFAAIHGVTA